VANAVIIGAPELHMTEIAGSYSAASSTLSSSFAATNVAGFEPAETWRSGSRFAKESYAQIYFGSSIRSKSSSQSALVSDLPITGVGICNHNLRVNHGLYRIIGGAINTYPEILVPTGLVSSTNATGTYTDVDENYQAPDGNVITATVTTSAWDANLSFGSPAANPSTGAYRQQFWLRVKKSGGSDTGTPKIKAELYESGVLTLDLGTKYVVSESYVWIFFPWDATELVTATGANVELKLTVTPSTSSDWTVSLDTVAWICEEDADINNAALVTWDSGWLQYSEPDLSGQLTDLSGPQKCIYFQQDVSTGIHRLQVFFADDWCPFIADIDLSSGSIPDPSTEPFVECGAIFAGKRFSPTSNIAFGGLLGTYQIGQPKYTDGGQTYGSNLPSLRELHLDMEFLSPAEAHALYDRLVLRKGYLRPVFVAAIPNDATEGYLTSFPAVLANAPDMTTTQDAEYGRKMSFVFREKR